VAVVIDQMESTIDTGAAAEASAARAPAGDGGAALDDEDFRHRYGLLLRTLIREEIESYLRSID
jgi:hypothetical protein